MFHILFQSRLILDGCEVMISIPTELAADLGTVQSVGSDSTLEIWCYQDRLNPDQSLDNTGGMFPISINSMPINLWVGS